VFQQKEKKDSVIPKTNRGSPTSGSFLCNMRLTELNKQRAKKEKESEENSDCAIFLHTIKTKISKMN
jgi:hypothetical protein